MMPFIHQKLPLPRECSSLNGFCMLGELMDGVMLLDDDPSSLMS
jgi:hypothetical protein